MECPSSCILRVQNSVYCWPGGACWAAGQCGAQGPVMCGVGLHVRGDPGSLSGPSPAMLVLRISRASRVSSNRHTLCMDCLLSQITRSFNCHLWTYTKSRCVACSVRCRRRSSASGFSQPTIAPAWEERNKDFRPVFRSSRTKGYRTVPKILRSPCDMSSNPIRSLECRRECSQTRLLTNFFIVKSSAS